MRSRRNNTTLTRKVDKWNPRKVWLIMAAEPELRAACTTCALKAGVATGGKH